MARGAKLNLLTWVDARGNVNLFQFLGGRMINGFYFETSEYYVKHPPGLQGHRHTPLQRGTGVGKKPFGSRISCFSSNKTVFSALCAHQIIKHIVNEWYILELKSYISALNYKKKKRV